MPPSRNLTDTFVRTVIPPAKGQAEYRDGIPGFSLRVSQGGAKTFSLMVNHQRTTLGRYPIITLAQARQKAKDILATRQLGLAPAPSPPMTAVIDEYLAERNIRPSTRRNDGYILKRFRSETPIAATTAKDIERILAQIAAPIGRHNAYVRLKGLFRYARRRGYAQTSPVEAPNAPRSPGSRERVLSPDELAKVVHTAKIWAESHQYGAIVLLCIYTGQRRNQIASLREAMVDFEAMTMTWPPELMKTGRRHTIPFGPMTKAMLEHRHTLDGYYFPSRVGGAFRGWTDVAAKFRQDCGFDGWILHDLRRTLATMWQALGIPIETTEKYLSHRAVTGGLVGVYQRYEYLAEMGEAVATWEAYLSRITGT